MSNEQKGYTTFSSIRIFFDIEKKQIIFHNGDRDHFRAVYVADNNTIEITYYGEQFNILRWVTVTAPRKLKDNIEMWYYDPNIAIDIEGITGAEYDKRKKEMFQLIKQHREERKKENA